VMVKPGAVDDIGAQVIARPVFSSSAIVRQPACPDCGALVTDADGTLVPPALLAKRRTRCPRFKVVANLPYAIAVPIISNVLLSDLNPERLVVTVQWEIAERLTATVSTKPYGALAVLMQSVADVTIVRRLPPTVFWPRPQVESAIVLIRPNAAKRERVGDVVRFRHFLRDLYVHRRKNLRGALVSLPHGNFSKEEVDAKLAELGIEGTIRAEALDPEQHLRLCAVFG